MGHCTTWRYPLHIIAALEASLWRLSMYTRERERGRVARASPRYLETRHDMTASARRPEHITAAGIRNADFCLVCSSTTYHIFCFAFAMVPSTTLIP